MSAIEWVLVSVAAVSATFGLVALLALLRARRLSSRRRQRRANDVQGGGEPTRPLPSRTPFLASFGLALLAGTLGSSLGAAAIWLLISSGRLPVPAGPEDGFPEQPAGRPEYLVSTGGAAIPSGVIPDRANPDEPDRDEQNRGATSAEASTVGGRQESPQAGQSESEQLEYLRSQLEVVVQQRDQNASVLSQQTALVRQYQQQLRDAQRMVEGTEAELAELKTELDTARAQVAQATLSLDERKRELQQSAEQLATAQDRCQDLERRLSTVIAARPSSEDPGQAASVAAADPPLDSSGWKSVPLESSPIELGRPVIEVPLSYETQVYETPPPVSIRPAFPMVGSDPPLTWQR